MNHDFNHHSLLLKAAHGDAIGFLLRRPLNRLVSGEVAHAGMLLFELGDPFSTAKVDKKNAGADT